MAYVKRIYYDGVLVYPLTITDAVINPKTKEQLSVTLERLQATSYGIMDEQTIKHIISNESSTNRND